MPVPWFRKRYHFDVILVNHIMGTFVVSGEVVLIVFYFKLGWPFCLATAKPFGIFYRGQYEDHLCKIILLSEPVVKQTSFKKA